MFDADDQIEFVSRTVGRRTVDHEDAHVLTISRTYPTDVEDLWDALTSIERIPRWFLPITGGLREGGHYQLEGNAGGTVQRCEPPKSFDATWEFAGDVSWIEVSVTPDGEGARFTLDHITRGGEHWDLYGPAATGIGFEMGILGLALHLRTGEAIDPQLGMQWQTTDEAKRYMTRSGELWRDADVASGTDPDDAAGKAGRTLVAYTGG